MEPKLYFYTSISDHLTKSNGFHYFIFFGWQLFDFLGTYILTSGKVKPYPSSNYCDIS